MQDFDPESFPIGGSHSQMVKGPPIGNDSGSKDCVNLPSPTAVSRFKSTIAEVGYCLLQGFCDEGGMIGHIVGECQWRVRLRIFAKIVGGGKRGVHDAVPLFFLRRWGKLNVCWLKIGVEGDIERL